MKYKNEENIMNIVIKKKLSGTTLLNRELSP